MAVATARLRSRQAAFSTIVPGDMAVLHVSYRNKRPAMFKLDTSSLEKDFEIIDIKSTIKMDQQDGTFANTMRWRVMLAPKRSGELTIPSIRIRDAVTPELKLTVLPANPWLQSGEDIRVEVSTDKTSPRVGEQFNVKIRFYSNRLIGEGFLSDPKPVGTSQLGLGRDSVTRDVVDGVEYEVLERNLAMFAESPGKLTIDPVIFRGKLAATSTTNGSAAPRYFLRRSAPININVRPIAGDFQAENWYPLEKASISQQWQIPDGLQPGDKILRRIKLLSNGLPVDRFDAALFDVKTTSADSYLDQPRRKSIRRSFTHTGSLYRINCL